MMTAAASRRAQELREQGDAFVTATVVRAQRPTSAKAGNVAIVLADGTIEGFVGGVCTEHSVRVYSLRAIESGEPVLLRILPDAVSDEDVIESREVASDEGSVTVLNSCLSGGAVEVFLEPVLPAPRVLVVGDTPIAEAVRRLGAGLGLKLIAVVGGEPEASPGDLAVVVAGHGRDELHALRRGLQAGVPYVGLVASRARGAGVIAELRGDGVGDELLELIDVPAGIDIGARTPAEVALSILANVVAARRGTQAEEPATVARSMGAAGSARTEAPAPSGARNSMAPTIAVDPVCGMTVAAMPSTPSVVQEGETVYFCCEGCQAKFEAQHRHAVTAD